MAEVEITYKGSAIATMNASGTKTLETSGKYCEDDIEVEYTRPSALSPSLQSKTVSPSLSQQTVSPDSGYDGLSSVTVNAMPSGTAGTPTATKGTVSSNSVSVTPSVTNTTGYITGGTKTGTAVTVSASELVSGTKYISASGTSDVTNYASVSVNSGSITLNDLTLELGDLDGYTMGVNASGQVTFTASYDQASPSIDEVESGWIASSNQISGGAISVDLLAGYQLTTQSAQTITPTTTDQTIASGKYLTGTQTIKGDADLVAGNIKSGVDIFGVVGTYTGNSSGLDYETGEYSPSSDTAQPTISFTKTHTGRPIYVLISDTVELTTASSNSMVYWSLINWYDANGATLKATSSTRQYARYQYGYKTSSSISQNGNVMTSITALNNLVSSTSFTTTSSTSYYFRSNRTYKWIAIWA